MIVHKFQIPLEDEFTINLPAGAEVLSVQAQYGNPFLWALVDPSMPMIPRRFRFAGTGHTIEFDAAKLRHIDTFQMRDGALVFHVFEVLP